MAEAAQGIGRKIMTLNLIGISKISIRQLRKDHQDLYHICPGAEDMIRTLNLMGIPKISNRQLRDHPDLYNVCPGAIQTLNIHPVKIDGVFIELVDIICVSVKHDLRLLNGATLGQAYKVARSCGLRVCPGFFGLLICKEYKHQGYERFYVAMNQIPHDKHSSVFMIERDMGSGGPDQNGLYPKSLSSSFSDHPEILERHGEFKLNENDQILFWRPSNNT